MSVKKTEKIWHNGQWIDWDDAKIHVLSHVVNYGSAVFEGIRCYDTKQGPAIFRVRDHMQRLVNSAKIYRMELPYSADELCNVGVELVRKNKMRSEEHTSELQSRLHLVCRLLLEKKKDIPAKGRLRPPGSVGTPPNRLRTSRTLAGAPEHPPDRRRSATTRPASLLGARAPSPGPR